MNLKCEKAGCPLNGAVFAIPDGFEIAETEIPICGACNEPVAYTDDPAWTLEQIEGLINANPAN